MNESMDVSDRNIVFGDFNINLLKDCAKSNKLRGLFSLYGMKPTVNFPKRVTQETPTLIDLIFTNDDGKVECGQLFDQKISDHEAIVLKLKTNERPKMRMPMEVVSWEKYGKESLLNLLRDINHVNFDSLSINGKVMFLNWNLDDLMSQLTGEKS